MELVQGEVEEPAPVGWTVADMFNYIGWGVGAEEEVGLGDRGRGGGGWN